MPKSLAAGRHPVMLYVHGGFFATAHSLFAPFFAPWFVDPALKHGGIIVSADYRLLPTANGIADQLADLEDFWQWTRRDLPAILESRAPGHTLDFDHLALVGGSAGGYFATQLALSHPDEVSVLAIAYPGLDLKDHIFVSGPRSDAPALLQFPESQIPSKDDSLAWVQEHRKVVESKRNIDFTPFCVGLVQHGEFSKQMLEFGDTVLTTDELPIERVRNGGRLPKNV